MKIRVLCASAVGLVLLMGALTNDEPKAEANTEFAEKTDTIEAAE